MENNSKTTVINGMTFNYVNNPEFDAGEAYSTYPVYFRIYDKYYKKASADDELVEININGQEVL